MASKLTDTELTVGTDGHKITGVDADGKALTSGSDLTAKVNELQVEQTGIEPSYTFTYSTRVGESGNYGGQSYRKLYTTYLDSTKEDLPKKSLSEAVKFLAQYTSHASFREVCTCDIDLYCNCNNDCNSQGNPDDE